MPELPKTMVDMLANLTKFHWSAEKPETVVLPDGTGIGRIAGEDYAAFNIAWATASPMVTRAAHELAVSTMTRAKLVLDQLVDDNLMLRDVVTLMTLMEFMEWYEQCRDYVSKDGQELLDVVFSRWSETYHEHVRGLRQDG